MGKLVYTLFGIGSKVAKSVGLAKALRATIGPFAGRLAYRIAGDSEQPALVNGHRMILASEGRYPPINMATNRYEVETTRLFERVVEPGMVVVDAGAHVGYFTLAAARLVGPTGRVHSFEPEPVNHALLLRNIELNEYQNVTPVRQALSNQAGNATLFLTALDSGRHSTYQHDLPMSGSLIIETTTLDEYLENQGWPKIDLVKIDVEGAEIDVLDGMAELLNKSEEIKLIVEFNPILLASAGVDPFQFLDKPASLGFKAYCIDENKGEIPLQDIDVLSVVGKLSASKGSLNLFWVKQ